MVDEVDVMKLSDGGHQVVAPEARMPNRVIAALPAILSVNSVISVVNKGVTFYHGSHGEHG